MRDALLEGLTCPVNRYHMGVGAENIQVRWEISREDQDELAVLSHRRAVEAVQSGKFTSQIAPVTIPQRRGDPVVIDTDEGPRADSSMEILAKLRPVFKEGGTVTAGNASSINDGAAAVVIMSEEKARSLGIEPRLRWHTRGARGCRSCVLRHRSRAGGAEGARKVGHDGGRHRPDGVERGVCRFRRCTASESSNWTWRRRTSTGAGLASGIR